MCNGMTVGISVTGADRRSGALGVVPGSHRANVQPARLDASLDLEPILLETRTGDITVHCSDTLHMSHRPKDRPRKVVYTAFRMPPKAGDVVPALSRSEERAARARLTNVRDRIEASDRSR
jgi:ectoine hydroxylase-related dioxygenase (phytanoyl-CoA dioxygenase family)